MKKKKARQYIKKAKNVKSREEDTLFVVGKLNETLLCEAKAFADLPPQCEKTCKYFNSCTKPAKFKYIEQIEDIKRKWEKEKQETSHACGLYTCFGCGKLVETVYSEDGMCEECHTNKKSNIKDDCLETKIVQIIKKVRTMYKYYKKYNEILQTNPSISITEKDGKLFLNSIIFDNYDQIIISKNHIVFSDYYGHKEELITYNGFDELLLKNGL